MAESVPPPSTPRRRLGCGGTIVLVVLILALLGGFVLYRLEKITGVAVTAGSADLRSLAGHVRDAFVAVTRMQPQVNVNEEVIYTQTSPVLELAVVDEQTVVERETSTTWLGSTKRLRLRGVYHVKAGYDQREPFVVRVDATTPSRVSVALPRAKILSVEQVKLDVLTMENGVWNHVNADDLTNEVNELNLDARTKARESGILEHAQRSLSDQLREKLGPAYDLQISSLAGAALSSTPSPSTKP